MEIGVFIYGFNNFFLAAEREWGLPRTIRAPLTNDINYYLAQITGERKQSK